MYIMCHRHQHWGISFLSCTVHKGSPTTLPLGGIKNVCWWHLVYMLKQEHKLHLFITWDVISLKTQVLLQHLFSRGKDWHGLITKIMTSSSTPKHLCVPWLSPLFHIETFQKWTESLIRQQPNTYCSFAVKDFFRLAIY